MNRGIVNFSRNGTQSVAASSRGSQLRRVGRRCGLYSPRACERMTAIVSLCISRELLNHTYSLATQTRLRVAGEAGSHRGGAQAGRAESTRRCAECRFLRAKTAAHHEMCRLEVAAARHRRSTQLLSLGQSPSSLGNRPPSSRATLRGPPAAVLPDWSFCGAQNLRNTASKCL